MAIRFNRSFNVNRVVKRLVRTVLALYVGGTIMTTFGTVMNATYSPFYQGLSLIGYTISTVHNVTVGGSAPCVTTASLDAGEVTDLGNCITATSGTGILAVVGIIAIAQVVTEFITW